MSAPPERVDHAIFPVSEGDISTGVSGFGRLPTEAELGDVIAITREIFGAAPSIETMVDPEDPEFSWLVYTVPWTGTIKDAVDAQILWHGRVDKVRPNEFGIHRLSIDPVNGCS